MSAVDNRRNHGLRTSGAVGMTMLLICYFHSQEGKDKQFLMRQIKELNGEKAQSIRQIRAASAKSARHRQTVQVQDQESELVHRRPMEENQKQTEYGEKY